MAKVFDYAEGIPGTPKSLQLERVVALHKDVQRVLDRKAAHILAKAEKNMAEHRDTGNAHVGMEDGDVDRYVYLEDPPRWKWTRRGDFEEYREDPPAALVIEMRLGILSRAAGLK